MLSVRAMLSDPTRLFRAAVLGAAMIAGGAGLTGCSSDGGSSQATIAEDYDAGNYESAYKRAVQVANRSSGRAKDEASLYAGLSAQSMGDTAEAEKWLAPLTSSSDSAIAGRAGAALGVLEMDRGNHQRAVTLLEQASRNLSGDDAARALYYAGQSYEAMGNNAQATAKYREASSLAMDSSLKSQIDSRMSAGGQTAGGGSGGYSIQLGAFGNRANADKLASQVAGQAESLGFGQPRVAQKQDGSGRTLWVVYVGRFPSLQEASKAKKPFGGGAFAAAATD